jgi:tetratricopeptide (TPR) repeat protein
MNEQYFFHFKRGKALLDVNRNEQALEEFSKALTFDSEGIDALAMLSMTQLNLKKWDVAIESIHQLLGKHPSFAFGHYLLANYFLYKEQKYTEAEKSILEAIRLDSLDANYFGLYASIFLAEKKWEKALLMANQGLIVDAENTDCLNTRATALNKLNRTDEMDQTVDKLLELNPNDAYSHANVGWSKLEQNDHIGAREHFKEALRVNPNLGTAREGLLESIKAKNLLYRLFLKHQLWLGNLQKFAMIAVLVGFMMFRVYLSEQDNVWASVLFYALFSFVLLSWIMTPLSNLLLRLDPMGKMLLNKKEIMVSNLAACGLLATIVSAGLYFMIDDRSERLSWLIIAQISFGLTIVWTRYLESNAPTKNIKHSLAIAFFTITGLMAYLYAFDTDYDFAAVGITYFFNGFVAYTWLYSFIAKE